MTLPDLAAEEDRLLQRVEAIHGLLEEKAARLHAEGIIDAYTAVYHAYADLITDPAQGDEALKRALFLQWIAFIEPTPFTGIGALDHDTQHQVLKAVQRRLAEDRVDDELSGMLRWYHCITDWYVDEFPDLPLLRRFLQDTSADIRLADIFTQEALQGRGQMGEYWLDMLQGQEQDRR